MSAHAEKYKGNFAQFLVFLLVLGAAFYAIQTWAITPAFQKAIVSLFGEGAKEVTPNLYVNEKTGFILDMTDVEKHEEEGKDGTYNKPAGEWVVKGEALGEHPIAIQPWLTFGVLSMFIAFIIAVIVTTMMPRQIGYIANKIEREIAHTIDKIDEQTGDKLSREEIERITAPGSKDDLTPIARQFGPVIVNEIEDVRAARAWQRSGHIPFMKGLNLYMTRHFAEKYANNVQGFAYGGAALLIIIIGIRGLKFIPATQPSILLTSITLEFSMLALLAITLYYTEEEQRMDKLIRDLEESSEGQKYELINLVRTSQQQQRDLASMVDYIQRQTDNLQRMADALTGANKDYIIQVAQRAVAEYVTKEASMEITEKVIREKVDQAMRQLFSGGDNPVLGSTAVDQG